VDEDGRISVVTEEYMRDISEKKEFPTSMRTSMGMLISWESRPSLGALTVRVSSRPVVSFALTRFIGGCDERVIAAVLSIPSTVVLVLVLVDMGDR